VAFIVESLGWDGVGSPFQYGRGGVEHSGVNLSLITSVPVMICLCLGGVVYNFGRVCLSVCQTMTFESLDVGSSYLHIRYISSECGQGGIYSCCKPVEKADLGDLGDSSPPMGCRGEVPVGGLGQSSQQLVNFY